MQGEGQVYSSLIKIRPQNSFFSLVSNNDKAYLRVMLPYNLLISPSVLTSHHFLLLFYCYCSRERGKGKNEMEKMSKINASIVRHDTTDLEF